MGVFGLAMLIILVSLGQLIYRLSLPNEGWSFARDTTGTNRLIIFDRDLINRPQDFPSRQRSIQPGDIVINIAGRQSDTVLLDALTFRSERPAEWQVGETLYYTVIREDNVLQVDVQLVRLSLEQILLNLGRNWLINPGPLLTLLVALFVFFRHPTSRPAQLLLLFSATVFASDGLSQGVTGTNVIGPAEMFDPSAFWLAQLLNAFIWPFLTAPLYIHLFLSFLVPRRLAITRYPRLTLLILYGLMPVMTALVWLNSGGQALTFWHNWAALSFADFVIILVLAMGAMIFTLLTIKDASQRPRCSGWPGGHC